MPATTPRHFTDKQLVDIFQDSTDKRYFGLIYERYHDRVYRCCLGILKDSTRASDLTQDVMLIVMDKLPQLRDGSQLGFWIYQISKNEAYKAAKHSALSRTDNIESKLNYAAETDNKKELLDRELELTLVRRALSQLNSLDRQVIKLKYFGQASISDLQQETGLSASAVKMRLFRARGQMLSIFKKNKVLVNIFFDEWSMRILPQNSWIKSAIISLPWKNISYGAAR